jgi:triphosphoribosyl-dephospho-CoA synthase
MAVEDFIRSARAIAPVMAEPGLTVGERILKSVKATRDVVNCNTNLGIVLLFAPLCSAVRNCDSFKQLPAALSAVLAQLTVDDARHCYQAIRMAEAGGLGNSAEQDIRQTPSVTLLQAMELARDRDQIALQYVSNFNTLWQLGLPALTNSLNSGESVEWATAFAYLKLLSDAPDSLICRKQNPELATAVTNKAKQLVFQMNKNSKLNTYSAQLTAWDIELKQKSINPGTTADLVAATLLLCAFERGFSADRISVP